MASMLGNRRRRHSTTAPTPTITPTRVGYGFYASPTKDGNYCGSSACSDNEYANLRFDCNPCFFVLIERAAQIVQVHGDPSQFF